jgi:hypothetical protein
MSKLAGRDLGNGMECHGRQVPLSRMHAVECFTAGTSSAVAGLQQVPWHSK